MNLTNILRGGFKSKFDRDIDPLLSPDVVDATIRGIAAGVTIIINVTKRGIKKRIKDLLS